MALSITNNTASLVAQQNLNNSTNALNTSLQRLSSGLKINSGADGPAALVISNEQGAQISGLQSAIENTNQAVSLVQTGEGALSEVNNLLVQIRGLAVSAANSAVNDPTALAADQAQIQNALQTINSISSNTQFGTRKLLDGSAGISSSTLAPAGATAAKFAVVSAADNTPTGVYAINVTTAATKARVETAAAADTGITAADTLTLNGTTINLASGSTNSQVAGAINAVSSQTNVSADVVTTAALTAAFTHDSDAGVAATATDLAHVDQIHGTGAGGIINTGDSIKFSGVDAFGKSFSGTFTYTGAAGGQTVGDLITTIQTALGTAAANGEVNINGSGQIVISSDGTAHGTATTNPADVSVSLSLSNGTGGTVAQTNRTASTVATDKLRLLSTAYGSAATIAVEDQNGPVGSGGTGLTAAATTTTVTGTDVIGTINGQVGSGSGNVLSGATGSSLAGLSVAINPLNDNNAYETATGAAGTLALTNNTLTFQIGANAGQTATLAIDSVNTNALATGASNTSNFQNLGQINVTTAQGAQDSLALVDAAISQISTLSGKLGSFQTNTLQATATNLQTALTNTTAAQSVIRDTDFAAETANFTKEQVLVQAGTTVLTNANATAQLILNLLK